MKAKLKLHTGEQFVYQSCGLWLPSHIYVFLRIIFYFSHLVFLCLLKPLVQKALVKGAICRAKSSSSVRTGSLRAQGAGCTMLEPERKCFLKSSQKRLKPAPVHRVCLAQQLVLAEL